MNKGGTKICRKCGQSKMFDCWNLSNLRPLSAKQNLIDGARA